MKLIKKWPESMKGEFNALLEQYLINRHIVDEREHYDALSDAICYAIFMNISHPHELLLPRSSRKTDGQNGIEGTWNLVTLTPEGPPSTRDIGIPGDVWAEVDKNSANSPIRALYVNGIDHWQAVPLDTPLGVYEHPVQHEDNKFVLALGAKELLWVRLSTFRNWHNKFYPRSFTGDRGEFLGPAEVSVGHAIAVVYREATQIVAKLRKRSDRGLTWRKGDIQATDFPRNRAQITPQDAPSSVVPSNRPSHSLPPVELRPLSQVFPAVEVSPNASDALPPTSPLSARSPPQDIRSLLQVSPTVDAPLHASDAPPSTSPLSPGPPPLDVLSLDDGAASNSVAVDPIPPSVPEPPHDLNIVFIPDPIVQHTKPENHHWEPDRACWWATTWLMVLEYLDLKASCPKAVYLNVEFESVDKSSLQDRYQLIPVDVTEWVKYPLRDHSDNTLTC